MLTTHMADGFKASVAKVDYIFHTVCVTVFLNNSLLDIMSSELEHNIRTNEVSRRTLS